MKRKNSEIGRIFSVLQCTAFIGIALFLSACSRQTAGADTAAQSGAELRYGFSSEPATLDPLNPANTADGRSILFNVFEGLVKPDTSGGLVPCAAQSWKIEQGGLVYHFTLREDVRFHDGSLLTSADARFTLETARAAGFPGFAEIEKIETNGALELRVTLKNPDPEFLPYLTVGIVKADSTGREKNANGTGSFYIESYTVQQSLVLRRFGDYWQPAEIMSGAGVPLEKVSVVFFSDSNALLLGLLGGGIDGASLTGSLARQLKPADFDIVPAPSASVQLLALNNAAAPLDDIRVRQAINFAVDAREIIDTAFFGTGEPSGSPLIPGLSRYYETTLANAYPADIQRARDLLAQAGYGGGQGEKKLTLEITVPSNYTMHVDTAQVIAVQLAKAGINAEIKQVDWAAWLSDVYTKREYQATIISLDGINISPRSFLSRYQSRASDNFINFNNAEFDRVYEEALTETSEGRRIALYKEAQKIISRQAASVYIQDIVGFKVFRAGRFSGIKNYPLYVIDFASMYKRGN